MNNVISFDKPIFENKLDNKEFLKIISGTIKEEELYVFFSDQGCIKTLGLNMTGEISYFVGEPFYMKIGSEKSKTKEILPNDVIPKTWELVSEKISIMNVLSYFIFRSFFMIMFSKNLLITELDNMNFDKQKINEIINFKKEFNEQSLKDWDMDKIKKNISQVNPRAKIFFISSKTGEGIDGWIDYLRSSGGGAVSKTPYAVK